MDEQKSTSWGGAGVDSDKAYTNATEGTVREDVHQGQFSKEPASGGLSTADIAGEAPGKREQRQDDVSPPAAQAGRSSEEQTPLFPETDAEPFRQRWQELQTAFVDNPRNAVQQADALVAEVMQRLAGTFADERKNLEGHWERGADVSTEDLRVALQRYRSFFSRLLAV